MKGYLKIIVASVILAFLASGCNHTMQGFGKDMENNGQEIQKAAKTDKTNNN